jgi:hypothetical protein
MARWAEMSLRGTEQMPPEAESWMLGRRASGPLLGGKTPLRWLQVYRLLSTEPVML